tara:strand:+ start:808 stop:1056 length:249 start_codon:yes stop_codon:yes gene_type:complete
MNTYATIIVANTNKAAAQALLGEGFFDIPLKKGIRKYWVSSGPFLTTEYDAMVDSELAYSIDAENTFTEVVSTLGMTKIIEE